MVVVFEMAADYFRGDVHKASETNGSKLKDRYAFVVVCFVLFILFF